MRIDERMPVEENIFLPGSMTTSIGSSEDDSSLTADASPITPLPIEDCFYRGEGNANVVIALPQERKVIRFRKSLPEEVSPDGGKLRVEREVEFVRSVISCFLGSYAQTPEILHCDIKDMARLLEAIRAHRPERRRHKEIAEVYATKMPDYTFLRTPFEDGLFRSKSTFCVEIKPKQGYLGKSERRFQKCPYCLTQYYKLKKEVIAARSTYCPLDLFSGVQERMTTALKGLLDSPQNNLKIFKDGIVVYDQESSPGDLERVLADWFRNSGTTTKAGDVEKFCELICAALFYSFAKEQSNPSVSLANNFLVLAQHNAPPKTCVTPDVVTKAKKILYFAGEECNLTSEGLPKDSVLERILQIQRLPYISAEYIYNTYAKLSAILTDEVIYSNLIKSRRRNEYQVSPHKQASIIKENTKSLLDTYLRIPTTATPISRRSKYDSDSNGNRHNHSEGPRSPNNDVHIIPQKSSFYPTYLEHYKLHSQQARLICNRDDTNHSEQKADSLISIESIFAIQNYLLFSTARDCSILMAFQEHEPCSISAAPYNHVIKLSNDLSFFCDIGVSDLDPKSFHCIKKHRKRDLDVLNAVISIIEEELTAKNQSLESRLSQ